MTCVLQCVQLATMANSVLKCASTVTTTPRVTTGTVTANVCPAGLRLTAPNVSATSFHVTAVMITTYYQPLSFGIINSLVF